jgi:flagellar basal body-associated protein FliL
MSDAAEETNEDKAESKSGGGGFKRILGMAMLLLFFLGAQAGIAWYIVQQLKPHTPEAPGAEHAADPHADPHAENATDEHAEEAPAEEEGKGEEKGPGMTFEKPFEITINIAETNGERFLVLAVNFEWDADKYAKAADATKHGGAKILDIVNRIAGARPIAELTARDAQANLSRAILQEVNRTLDKEKVQFRACYIQKFLIQ